MRKIFTKLLGLMALCLICALNARAATDEKGNFIYYSGTGGFYQLQAAEAEWYEDWKLYETAPGSNVYARLFTTALSDYSELWFKFYTELSDADLFSNDYFRRNIIVADGNDAHGSAGSAAAINQSRIYSAALKSYRLCTDIGINDFICTKEKGAVYIVVDMNNKKVSVIPTGHYLMVLKGQPEPDFGNLTDYISAYEDHYFEPGDYEFNMYDIDAKLNNLNSPKWVIPQDGQEVLYDNGAKPVCDVRISSHNRDSHFIIRNWPGGIIHPYPVGAKFSPDKNAAREDVIYVNLNNKPFLPWAGCSEEVAQTAYRLTKNGDKYTGTFPYDDIADGFNLIVEPGAKGQPAAKVLCPPTDTDIDLHIVDDCAYAPVAVKTGDKAAYYRSYKSNGKDVNIEVTPGDKPTIMVSYTSSTPANEKTGKYLRGSFTGWSPLDAWEFVTTSTPNRYVIRDVTIPEGSEFKVADANWAAINWGALDSDPIYPDREFKLNTDMNCYNIQYGYGFGDFRGNVWLLLSPTGEWKLRLSTDTNETPDPTEDPQDTCPYFVWDRNYLSSFEYDEIQGMYYSYVRGHKDEDELALNLFAKELPYDCHDELWAGSWAINAPYDNYVLEFDEYGVAESSFTVHEGLTTEKPAQFILRRSDNPISDSWGNWTYHLYIDKDAQKLYAYKGKNCAIFGSFNDYEIPTIKNREKFANWYLPHHAGGLFDFPQGDVDYTHLYRNGIAHNAFSMEQVEPEFTVTMGSEGYVLYNWSPWRAIVKNWKGGKALIAALYTGEGPSYFIDDSIINEFNFIGWEGRLTRENADSDIYTGEVTVDPAKLADTRSYLNLQLSSDHSLKFGLSGYDSHDFDENGEITMEMSIGAWGSNSLYNPCITAPCRFKATFDLKKLELTLKLIDGQLATKFELVANPGSDLDGIFGAGKDNDSVSFYCTASNDAGNEVSFNLISNTGQIVAPAADTEITFDKFGYWEGKSVDMAKSPARMRAAARKAADASAKWHFNLPADCEGSALVMEYDMASNTIRLHSSAHNEGFFVVQESDEYNGGISNLDTLKENRLEMTSDGIFEGEIELNPANNGYYSKVKFTQSINMNCNTTNIAHLGVGAEGSNNPMLSAENPAADYWAWNQNCRSDLLNDAQWWEVSATKQNVRVKFDASRLAMQFTMDTAGVEDVIADRNDPAAIVITTGNGTITFTAPADMTLPIYSISGATVRVLNLSAGTTTINIAAGYYIAAGRKIMVR